jgi:DNA-binding GntR family transcriptional regulator
VVLISGNTVLADFTASVDRRVRWYSLPIARTGGKGSWDEHAELINGIARRNASNHNVWDRLLPCASRRDFAAEP